MESQAKTRVVFEVKTQANIFLLNWAPEYDPDLASLGSTAEADLKALGIKLPLLKLPLIKLLLIKGLVKFPIFKPVLKLFVKKPAKLLFETLGCNSIEKFLA